MHPGNHQSILTTLLVVAIGGAVHGAGAHDSPDTIFASQQTASAPDMADAFADDFDLQEDENAEAVETITERYPDGTTKISRQVTQDAGHNYVNHGTWTSWNQRGEKLSQGEFRLGKRHGWWTRLYTFSELRKANIPIQRGFEQPFLSETSFNDGRLDGTWRILDTRGRPVAKWEFADGKLHGATALYFANGTTHFEVQYQRGVLHGSLSRWKETGQLVKRREFDGGREHVTHQERHPNGTVLVEGTILRARRDVQLEVDWWHARIHTEFADAAGEDVRYGKWTFRHPNGNKKLELSFDDGIPHGPIFGWHPNGQRLVDGHYVDGQKHGHWTWWHANGQKYIEGRFQNGDQLAQWIQWRDTGRVAHVREHALPAGESDGPLYSNKPELRSNQSLRQSRRASGQRN